MPDAFEKGSIVHTCPASDQPVTEFAYVSRHLYSALRWRLFIWLTLTVLASGLEGVTVSLFLPIISGADSDSPLQSFFTGAFDRLGVTYTLPVALGAMAIIYGLRTVLVVLQQVYVSRVIATLMVEVKSRVVRQILRADFQYFTSRGVGHFNNAVTVEFTNLTNAFEYCTRTMVAAAFALTYVLLALAINPVLSLAFLGAAVPTYFLLRAALRLVQRISVMRTENNSRLQSHLLQALNGFKYFKATAATGGMSRAVTGAVEDQGRLFYRQRRLSALVRNGVDLLTVLAIVGLLLYYVEVLGTAFIEMVFILVILRRTATFAQSTQRSLQQFLDFSGSVRLLRELQSELSDHEESFPADAVHPNFSLPIRMENVTFAYAGAEPVLRNVSLVIPPRSKVAFVGASGAGKTTLATLLTGILRPTSGQISVGSVPYSRVDHLRLRSAIGYVTQESVIFNDTVRNNVSLWDDTETAGERVVMALESAQATDFVEGLPDGCETLLGDDGMKISGGQRQRIAIARELYKHPRVLIFDEGTSALDTRSELLIEENLDRLRDDTTVIVIAHRLSTVRNSDRVFVLDDGQIVEHGTYDCLYDLGGRFTEMVDRQAPGEGLVIDREPVKP